MMWRSARCMNMYCKVLTPVLQTTCKVLFFVGFFCTEWGKKYSCQCVLFPCDLLEFFMCSHGMMCVCVCVYAHRCEFTRILKVFEHFRCTLPSEKDPNKPFNKKCQKDIVTDQWHWLNIQYKTDLRSDLVTSWIKLLYQNPLVRIITNKSFYFFVSIYLDVLDKAMFYNLFSSHQPLSIWQKSYKEIV